MVKDSSQLTVITECIPVLVALDLSGLASPNLGACGSIAVGAG